MPEIGPELTRKPTEQDCRDFRQMLLDNVAAIPQPYELALSGGVDSTTVLFAMLELGIKPRCLTFHCDGIESNDLRSVRQLQQHFDLDVEVVTVPSDPDSMIRDVKLVLPYCGTIKKTIVQTLIPWLYLAPASRTQHIVYGVSADDHYCNTRKYQTILREQGERAALQWRYFDNDDLNYTAANILRFNRMCYGVTLHDPYACLTMQRWFRQFWLQSLNDPFEKHVSVRAFMDYYRQGPFRRLRSSYQVNSGLRDLHAGRLMHSQHNLGKHTDPIGLYNLLAKSISPVTANG